jgi:hypothetical protein
MAIGRGRYKGSRERRSVSALIIRCHTSERNPTSGRVPVAGKLGFRRCSALCAWEFRCRSRTRGGTVRTQRNRIAIGEDAGPEGFVRAAGPSRRSAPAQPHLRQGCPRTGARWARDARLFDDAGGLTATVLTKEAWPPMSRCVPNSITCSQLPNHIRESAHRGCQVAVTGVVQAEPWIWRRPVAQHLD